MELYLEVQKLSEKIKELEAMTGPDTIDEIVKNLKEVEKYCTMERANFEHIRPEDSYPTNEKEADAFIKGRIRLWMNSWIGGPISQLIKKYDVK